MASPGWESTLFLGALVALAGGATALSLSSAPPVAEQQLHIGAGATIGAGSMVMDVTEVRQRIAIPGTGVPPQSSTLHIVYVYQAPDRWSETALDSRGRPIGELIIIGDQSYEKTPTGQWVHLPATAANAANAEMASQQNLALANLATKATPVTRYGKTSSSVYGYGLPLADFVRTFGTSPSALSSYRLGANIEGAYMTAQILSASNATASERITVGYSQIGTAPPVNPPPVSALRPRG